MRIFQSVLFLAVFLIFITVLAVFAPTRAADRPGYFSSGTFWGDGSETDYTIPPYVNGAVLPNNAQWKMHDWSPARWIGEGQSALDVIEHFYKTGLVVDQDVDDGVPVLEVSDLFLRLSDADKRKVLMMFDYSYDITSRSEPALFMIEHERTGDILGSYGVAGMQLQ